VLLAWKCIKIIFFYFKNFIFNISTPKQFKNTKKDLISRKQIQNLIKSWFNRNLKQGFNGVILCFDQKYFQVCLIFFGQNFLCWQQQMKFWLTKLDLLL